MFKDNKFEKAYLKLIKEDQELDRNNSKWQNSKYTEGLGIKDIMRNVKKDLKTQFPQLEFDIEPRKSRWYGRVHYDNEFTVRINAIPRDWLTKTYVNLDSITSDDWWAKCFQHGRLPSYIKPEIEEKIINIIEAYQNSFYVPDQTWHDGDIWPAHYETNYDYNIKPNKEVKLIGEKGSDKGFNYSYVKFGEDGSVLAEYSESGNEDYLDNFTHIKRSTLSSRAHDLKVGESLTDTYDIGNTTEIYIIERYK